MARSRYGPLLLALLLLLSAATCAGRQLFQEHGVEPGELEALMNPRVAEADGSDGGGASSESPAEVVTFSKKGKGGVGKGAPTKGGKFAKLVGGAKAAPVTAGDQQKKKAGKDMSVTEIEWEKKAINASIAGDVRHLASEKAALRCGWDGSRRRGARPLYLTARYQNDKVLHDLVRDILFTHRESIAQKTKQFCAKVRSDVDKEVALRQNFDAEIPDVGKKGRGR